MLSIVQLVVTLWIFYVEKGSQLKYFHFASTAPTWSSLLRLLGNIAIFTTVAAKIVIQYNLYKDVQNKLEEGGSVAQFLCVEETVSVAALAG